MEHIPQSSWTQIIYLACSYFMARILWSQFDMRRLHQLLIIILITGILEALYGLGQLYGIWASHHSLFSITGTFFNPGPFSGWLAAVLPIAVYGVLLEKTASVPSGRTLYYLGTVFLICAALVLIPAESRAAILACVLGTVVAAWPKIRSLPIWRYRWVKSALATVTLASLLGLYFLKKDSADGRLLIYKVTAQMIADAPLTGWGWDGFQRLSNTYQADYFLQGHGNEHEKYLAGHIEFGFNEVLEFTAEMGLIGLLIVCGIAFLLVRRWQDRPSTSFRHTPVDYLAAGVTVAWCTFSLFSYPMSIPALAVILPVTIAGINTALIHRDLEKSGPVDRNTFSFRLLVCAFLLACSGYGFYWTTHYIPLSLKWKAANIHQSNKEYSMANYLYRELYPDLQNEGLFLQFAGKSLSLEEQYDESTPMLERALLFTSDPTIYTTLGTDYSLSGPYNTEKNDRTEYLLTQAKYMSPYKYYPRYLLAQYYNAVGQSGKAREEAAELLKIQPKVISSATAEIRTVMESIVQQKFTYPVKNNNIPEEE